MQRSYVAVLLCLIAFTVAHHGHDHQLPVVHTALGAIKGSTLESRLGNKFYAFRGIRYAVPPVGPLRFQAPEPITEPWTGVYDATDDGPMCPQPTQNASDSMSEDCLRLNVYTQVIPGETTRIVPRDVLVYLHPGGFYVLSGQSKNFAGPATLMDKPIVFVAINYRLGSLGFMSTGTADCPGNAGFKDQVLALQWIQQNIANFGGNPNSVTLMGYSAGSMSAALHLVSPMSRGLFHRAIAMSAAPTGQWRVPSDQLDLAHKQANLLNCTTASVKAMIDCLREKPASAYADTLESMFVVSWNPVLLWRPVIEPDFGQQRFLDRNPTEAFRKGDFMRAPLIAGITKDEFANPAVSFLQNETLRKRLDENFETLAPILFLFEPNTSESRSISQQLRRRFLGSEPLSLNRSLLGLNYLFADGLIGFGMHRLVALASQHTTVYQYKFSYVGRYSHLYYPDNKPYGAVHHDDLFYLLGSLFKATDPENETVERMTSMWTTFARTGNPNDANLTGLHWIPAKGTEDHYLDIGNQLESKKGLFTERFTFWEQLFPLQ